jgi:3-phosphoshikimate 1-carboxyvinyltransferase
MAAAGMAEGRSHLYGGLDAGDPRAMEGALEAFGIGVDMSGDPWVIDGGGSRLHAPTGPLDAGESGLTARIVMAMAASADGTTRIVGRGRLPERPMSGLIDALRAQGVEIDGESLPLEVSGRGRLWGGQIHVDCAESSQHATALMLVAPTMNQPVNLEITGLGGSAGYLGMTAATMRRFGAAVRETITGYEIETGGYRPGDVMIEPDASAAVYPMAVAAVTGGRATIEGLGRDSGQPDMWVAAILEEMGCEVSWESDSVVIDARDRRLRPVDVDLSGSPDGALAVAVVCLVADGQSRLRGLGSLRHKESDRLEAMKSELERLGGEVDAGEDFLVVKGPATLRAATVDPHGDHRIAMSTALLGTIVPGVVVTHPDVVEKTWPGYWDFLDDLAG